MKYLLITFFHLGLLTCFSQSNLTVTFKPHNACLPIDFNSNLVNLTGENYQISFLYYYISDIQIVHDGGQILDLSDTVLIIRNENNILDFGLQPVNAIEQINFGVGVPQALNHLDISIYPIDHPLSYQIPPMQWGWTSGYNQVGIIGKVDVDNDGSPEVDFELFPLNDNLYKNIVLPVNVSSVNDTVSIKIRTNIDQWLKQINLGTNGFLHGSIGNNITLMENTTTYPVFTSESNADLIQIMAEEGQLSYSLIGDEIEVNWTEFQHASSYELVNLSGQELLKGKIHQNKDHVRISNLTNGNYWFIVRSEDGNQLNKLRILK